MSLPEAVKERPTKRGQDGDGREDPKKVSKKDEGDGGGSTAKSAGNGQSVGTSKTDPGPPPVSGGVMSPPPPQQGDGDTKAVTEPPVWFDGLLEEILAVRTAPPQPAPSLTTSVVGVAPKVQPTSKAPAIPLPAPTSKSMVPKSNPSPATATPTGVSLSASTNPGTVIPAIAVTASGSINNPPASASTTAPATVMTAATTTTGNNNNNLMSSLASQLKSITTAAASSCWGATTGGWATIHSIFTVTSATFPNNANVVVNQPRPTSNLGRNGNTGSGAANVRPKSKPTTAKPRSKKVIRNRPGTTYVPPKPTIATPSSSGANTATASNMYLIPKAPAKVPFPYLPPKVPGLLQLPSWRARCSEVYKSASLYKTFPVLSNSTEYSTIAKLLSTLNVTSVEQIVNPDLWTRFINARREMLISKTDDATLLKQLGLEDREIARCQLLSVGFAKKLSFKKTEPFSPNEAILFHCTRDRKSLETILEQGLDERLSIPGGRKLLGNGIYFSDDFEKCLKYDGTGGNILVCLVLLGDCLAVDKHPDRASFVRGPEKDARIKRTLRDIFFDSITSRPTGPNEFVIFNRNQCCPLYLVKYCGKPSTGDAGSLFIPTAGADVGNYERARKSTPNFVWKYNSNGYGTPLLRNGMDSESWPFYAPSLLKLMGFVKGDSPIDMENGTSPFLAKNTTPPTSAKATNSRKEPNKNLEQFKLNMQEFLDEEKNRKALASCSNDPAPNLLLDNPPQLSSNSSTMKTTVGQPKVLAIGNKEVFKPKIHFPDEDCTICYNKYPALSLSPAHWTMLKCRHIICKNCHKRMETTGTTMSGTKHTSMKCPFCNQITGTQVGNCPNGKMKIRHIHQACAGYPPGTIHIHYLVDSGGYKLNRVAYLPDNDEGQKVLELLKTAWDRRLCFVIGTSVTTGAKNVLVWNIHHKTTLTGGTSCYGYPDPDYLRRVKWELKAFGIE